MNKLIISLTLLSTLLISCNNVQEETTFTETEVVVVDSVANTSPTEIEEAGSVNNVLPKSDSVFYSSKIFISILPSDKYLDSIQKVSPEGEWNEVASDNEYYRDLTATFLISKGYRLVARPEYKFWYFKLANGTTQKMDTLSLHDTWGNLIFNGKDSAFIFESASPEFELKGKI